MVAAVLLQPGAQAAVPFDSARLSLVENKVFAGDLTKGRGSQHQVTTGSEISAKQFIATEAESRAELKFADNSIVRVGQNSIFSFEAGSRSLSLKEGTMLFFVPHDSGGGNIKTPSFTAAITGTVGKVSKNMIAILNGEVKVTVGHTVYIVHAGEALVVDGNRVRIFRFKPEFATDGLLFSFDGVLPCTYDLYGGGFFGNTPGTGPVNPWITSLINRTNNILNPNSQPYYYKYNPYNNGNNYVTGLSLPKTKN